MDKGGRKYKLMGWVVGMVLPALCEDVLPSRVGLINIAQYHLLRIACVVSKRALLKLGSSQPQLFSLHIQPVGWWLCKRWSETEVKIVGFLAVWSAQVWGDNLCPGFQKFRLKGFLLVKCTPEATLGYSCTFCGFNVFRTLVWLGF